MAGCNSNVVSDGILGSSHDGKVWGPKDFFLRGQVIAQGFSSVNRVCCLRGASLTGVRVAGS